MLPFLIYNGLNILSCFILSLLLYPVIDEVASDYSDKVKFVKLNIDHNPSNTQKYGIRGIPTLILFKNGEKADTSVGVLSKSELSSFLDKNL